MRDAYELLGLTPGISPADIKRAFRRLAMRWHPDRNADPHAAEHFKLLRQAHDRLLEHLDGPGNDDDTLTATNEQETEAERQNGSRPRGADRFMDLELTIEETFNGGTRQVCLNRPTVCPQCDGSGSVRLNLTRLCTPCGGSGRLRGERGLERCSICDGRGYRNTGDCPTCSGSGQQNRERWLAVSLPAGLIDGDSLRLAGEGEPPPDAEGLPGDLHLRIRQRPHPLFALSGRELSIQRPISALRLLLGGTVRVPHPLGALDVSLEAGSATPRTVRIAGAGIPARAERPAGDLVIELQPIMVTELDARLRAQFEALETELQRTLPQHLPELAAWESRWMPRTE